MGMTIIEVTGRTPIERLDWESIRKKGIGGVMIAAGEAGYDGEVKLSDFAAPCLRGASSAGLDAGIIIYARCKSPFAAHAAAANVTRILEECGENIALPVALAFFERKHPCLIEQGTDGLTDTALAFLFEMKRNGRNAVIYTDLNFAETYLDIERMKPKSLWLDGMPEKERFEGKTAARRLFPWENGCVKELSEFSQYILL